MSIYKFDKEIYLIIRNVCVFQVVVLVIVYIWEFVYQIVYEYQIFLKYMLEIKVVVFFGGFLIKGDEEVFVKNCLNIVVGMFGCLLVFVQKKKFILDNFCYFIVDECD